MLLRDVESHRAQLLTCQQQFRKANLGCILQLQKRDKELLLAADGKLDNANSVLAGSDVSGTGLKQRRQSQNRGEIIKESGQITENLTAISRQLAATVQRSSMTVEELAQSSQAVAETQDEFKNMGSVIGQSRKLITKYGRRETTDRVLIFFAFCFFFACVFYVLRKRVLGPLDPFSLMWNAITTLVNTVMTLAGYN